MENKKTLIIGASTNPSRYAYLAANRLLDNGYPIELLGIKKGEIRGHEIKNRRDHFSDIHTVTLYVGPKHQEEYIDFVIGLKPQRVIFNPGTWNDEFVQSLKEENIDVLDACTLVMLSAHTY